MKAGFDVQLKEIKHAMFIDIYTRYLEKLPNTDFG